MKKQYTSMQQELAARRAAEASGAQGGQGEWHSRPTGGRGAKTWRSNDTGQGRSNAAPRNPVGKRTQGSSAMRKSLQSMVEQISLGPTRRAKRTVEKSSAPFQRNRASSASRAYTSAKSNQISSTPENLRVRISDAEDITGSEDQRIRISNVEDLTDAEDLRVRISDVEDLPYAEDLTAKAASKNKGRRKTSPAFFAFLAIFCLFFIGMVVDVAQDMGFDDDWDEHWAATTDYGIDEDSDDLAVQDYILDVTYAPDVDDVGQEALTMWLENFDALITDAPGGPASYGITILDNRILVNATFDPDVQDQDSVISYWEDAYYTIYDSLLEKDLEELPVCVVLRASAALQLRSILIDGGTNFTFSDNQGAGISPIPAPCFS